MTRQKSRTLKKQQLCEHLRYHSSKIFTFSSSYRDYTNYCKLGNKVSKAVHYSKKKYEKVVVETSKLNHKPFWGYVKEQTKSKSGMGDLKGENGDSVTQDIDKAELLNIFLASVFTSENDSEIPKCDQLIDDITLVTESILKQLSELNASKAIV